MPFYPHMRVDAGNGGERAFHLRLADALRIVDDLPLQVGQRNRVIVDDAERADTRRCQILQHRRAKTACADDQYAGGLQLLLARPADFRQHDVARVAFEFFG